MAGAIRFILKGHGTRLIVEGESFEIGEGDFVTTPSWTWHDHENHGGQAMMWLDGLDSPLVRLLETDFHEPDPRKKQPVTKPEGYTLATMGALRPSWVRQNSIQPPAFCYKWEDTEKALSKVGEQPGDPYYGIVLEYANPLTGGPTLPTMACQIHMLRSNEMKRLTATQVPRSIMYGKGSGVTTIGDKRYEWEKGDSFVVPLWYHHRHENTSKDPAVLFVMSGQAGDGSSGSLSRGREARIIVESNYPCSSSTTNSAPMNLLKHFSKPTRVIIRGSPTRPWRLCFAEENAPRINSKAGRRNAITSSRMSRQRNTPSFIIAPHPEVRRMWLPKAIQEEGEDLIGKPGKPHPEYWLEALRSARSQPRIRDQLRAALRCQIRCR